MTNPTPLSILAAAAPPLKAALLGTGGVMLGIGVTVWSMKRGWVIFKDLVADDRVRDMTWDYAGRIADMDATQASLEGDLMQGHSESELADWKSEAAGASAQDWEATATEDYKAASSYLDRYR